MLGFVALLFGGKVVLVNIFDAGRNIPKGKHRYPLAPSAPPTALAGWPPEAAR